MITSITLAQFTFDPAEVVRLVSNGIIVRVFHGGTLCFTIHPG